MSGIIKCCCRILINLISAFKNIVDPHVAPSYIFIPISPEGRSPVALKCDHTTARLPFGPTATVGVPSLGIPDTINVSSPFTFSGCSEDDLARRMGSDGATITIEVDVAGGADSALAVLTKLSGVSQATVLRQAGGVTSLRIASAGDQRAQVARALVMGGIDLVRIDRGAGRLENIFLQLTSNKDQPQ